MFVFSADLNPTKAEIDSGTSGKRSNSTHTADVMERDRIGMWGHGDNVIPGKLSGLDRIKHPGLNKVS